MSNNNNNNHGGQRKGAGRPPTGRPRKVKTSITLAPALLAHAEKTGNRSAYIEALIRRDTMRTFTLTAIAPDTITATDLRRDLAEIHAAGHPVEAYIVTIYDATGTRPAPEAAQALWVPSIDRLGIAWGADADWGDAQSVGAGIEMWLNDGEAWETAN